MSESNEEKKQKSDLNEMEEIRPSESNAKQSIVVTNEFNESVNEVNGDKQCDEVVANCGGDENEAKTEIETKLNEVKKDNEEKKESDVKYEREIEVSTADSESDSSSSSSTSEDTSEEERRRRRRKAKKKARKARLKQEKLEAKELLTDEEKELEEKKYKADKRSKKKAKKYKDYDEKERRSGKKSKKVKIEKTPEELAREAELREQRRLQRLADEEKAKKHYKYGRYFLLVLALASIPFDLYKLIDAIIKAENYITTSLHDSIGFYSGTLCTHLVGFVAAIEHQLWLTIFCRFICTFVYQFEMTSKSNETVPTDPDQLKKYADKKLFQKRGNPNKQLDPDDDVAMLLFNSEYFCWFIYENAFMSRQ